MIPGHRHALPAIFLLGLVLPLYAQVARSVQTDERLLQSRLLMAQQLERNGQIEQAAELYKSLFELQPGNTIYYDSYSRLLFNQKNFAEVERVIDKHLLANPSNEVGAVDRGRLYFMKGDTLRAYQAWQQVLAQFQHSISIYRTLFNCYLSLNLYSAGTKLIQDARLRHQRPALFALELANFHTRRGAPIAAAKEYLLFNRYNRGSYDMISAQFLRMELTPEQQMQLDSLLRAEISSRPEEIELHRVRAEFLFKIKAYPSAIDETLLIEQKTGNRGTTILELVNNLVAVQAYATAESLSTALLVTNRWSNIAPRLLLALADIVEKQYLEPNRRSPMNYLYPGNLFFNTAFVQRVPENLASLQRAFQIYDSLAHKATRSEYTATALWRLAELRFTVMRDFDGAARLYQQVEQQARDYALRLQARRRIGEVMLAKGAPDEAWRYFHQEALRFTGTDYEQTARIYALLATFLSGAVDSASSQVQDLLGILDATAEDFNDVVEFEGFLRNYYDPSEKADREGMLTLIKGELLLRQNKLSEAAQYYDYLCRRLAQARCLPIATFRLAQIALLFNDYETADSLVAELVNTDREWAVLALFMQAETADFYHPDLKRAASYYELILEKYPDFIQIAAVRKRLREIYRILNPTQES